MIAIIYTISNNMIAESESEPDNLFYNYAGSGGLSITFRQKPGISIRQAVTGVVNRR